MLIVVVSFATLTVLAGVVTSSNSQSAWVASPGSEIVNLTVNGTEGDAPPSNGELVNAEPWTYVLLRIFLTVSFMPSIASEIEPEVSIPDNNVPLL